MLFHGTITTCGLEYAVHDTVNFFFVSTAMMIFPSIRKQCLFVLRVFGAILTCSHGELYVCQANIIAIYGFDLVD